MRRVRQTATSLGLDEDGFAFYELIGKLDEETEPKVVREPPGPAYDAGRGPMPHVDPTRRDIARRVVEALRALVVVDWATKDDVQRRMRQELKTLLAASGYGRDRREAVAQALVNLARVRLS